MTPPSSRSDFDPDDACMVRLAGGDDAALDEIMGRWSARLASFLLRMTGNPATAADLTQESFVRLYQARSRFRPSGSFHSFLFQIAANLARNHHRWKQRHPEHSFEPDAMPEPGDTESRSPDVLAATSERMRAVAEAVQALPEDLRESLVLSVYEEMEQSQIAALLGTTRKTIEMRIYRARQMLRERLAGILGPAE